MQNSKELSIIIVNYRSEQYLKNCVASLFKYLQNINFEIIVVNNDNNILDAETHCNASLRADVNIQIINHQKNIGFGAANNLGAKIAQGEILWLLNPDTEVLAEDIGKILDRFKNNNNVAVIGPRLVKRSGETQPWCAGKEASVWRNIKNNLGLIESRTIWESKVTAAADWVSGAALFVRQDIFQKVGGFDEKFFMYLEDDDLCRRIRRSGQEIWYCPEVAVRHLGGQSRESGIKQKMQFYRSLVHYFRKARKNV